MMKNLFFAFCLLFFNSISAIHIVGGEINYTYIGDAQNPNRYLLNAFILLDTDGPPIPQLINIGVKSSCYSSTQRNLPLIEIINANANIYECTDTSIIHYYERAVYRDTIDLPGVCMDWTFSFSACCRQGSLNNLLDPSSRNIYLESILNNVNVHNSSSRFIDSPTHAFCVSSGKEQVWHQRAMDIDGDSLFYQLENSRHTENTVIAYVSGYNKTQPISSTGGVNFESSTGTFRLTPLQPEFVMITLSVEEYRSGPNGWEFMGKVYRDALVDVVNNCDTNVVDWSFSTSDSSLLDTVTINCGDSILNIYSSLEYDSSTVGSGGSNFMLIHDSLIYPLSTAYMPNENTIILELFKNISRNGIYYLYNKTNTSISPVKNKCGYELKPMVLQFMVNNCSGIGVREHNTGIKIYPNPVQNAIYIDGLSSAKAELIIYNLSGQIILRTNRVNEGILDISDVKPGTYIVSIRTTNQAIHQKISKL